MDALGLAGTRTSFNAAKNVLAVQAPEFMDRFLQMIALTTKLDLSITNDLKVASSFNLFHLISLFLQNS